MSEKVRKTNYTSYNPHHTYSFGGGFKKGIGDFSFDITGLGQALGENINHIGSAAGGMVGGLLSNGLESGVGSVFNTLGDIGGKLPGPWGAVIGAGAKILGGAANALIGTKVNQEALNAANQGTSYLNNFTSNASSFDEIQGPQAQESVGDVYEGGVFSGVKTAKKNAELRRQRQEALSFANRSVDNNIENIANEQMNNMLANYAAFGGPLHTHGTDWTNGITIIDNGGSHESNPFEGVPMGIAPDGQPNLVEEGEVIFNDYVFSNRLRVPKAVRKKYKLRGVKDMTFADAAKKAQKESEERPNDPISQRGLKDIMYRLMGEQEILRQKRQNRKYAEGGGIHIKPSKRGTFTAAASKHDMGVQEFASKVLANPDDYSPAMRKKAQFAKNASKWKHADGGPVNNRPLWENPYWEYYTFSPAPVSPATPTNSNKSPWWKDVNKNPWWNDIVWPSVMNPVSPAMNNGDKRRSLWENPNWEYYTFSPSPDTPSSPTPAMSNEDKKRLLVEKTLRDALTVPPSPYSPAEEREGIRGLMWERTLGDIRDALPSPTVPTTTNKDPRRKKLDWLSVMRDVNWPSSTSLSLPALTNNKNMDLLRKKPDVSSVRLAALPNDNIEDSGNNNENNNNNNNKNSWWKDVDWLSAMRFAPVIGAGLGVFSDLMGWTNKPDYSNAQSILDAAGSIGDVHYTPIGDYMRYTPLDRLFYANQLGAQAGATRRSIINTSGGNRGTAMAGLLSADYNAQSQLGDLFRKAEEYNFGQRGKVAEFNRATNVFNAESDLKAQIANRESAEARARATVQAAGLREQVDARVGAARTANLTNFLQGLGDIGREEVVASWINKNPAFLYTASRGGSGIDYKSLGYKYNPETGEAIHANGGGITIKNKRRRNNA